jgi:hypothetical protein
MISEDKIESVTVNGKKVDVRPLRGSEIDAFWGMEDRTIDGELFKASRVRIAYGLFKGATIDGQAVYANPIEPLKENMAVWNALSDAWLAANGMGQQKN